MLKFEQKACEKEKDERLIKLIARETGLCIEAADILWQRGISGISEAKLFLEPSIEQINDPFLLPDMKESVQRIQKAVNEGEIVTVFCDYDADGTCGGSSLYLHLKSLGLSVNIMSPNRHKEGYGLSEAAVKKIDEDDSTLIITVDCGITNIEEVALATELGIDVIITDHHECGAELPDTPYIINPKRPDSEYPCPFIAGCGVAFKLIQALSGLESAFDYIDLTAIGTVTDIVALKDENRALVHFGIEKLKEKPSAGIEALSRVAAIKINSSMGVSFGLGPRINAAGRMDTAQLAIEILSAQAPSQELDEKARQLCRLNDQRRQEVEDITQSAQEMVIANEYMNDAAILLADENWNTGVIGIAAARIADKFSRPCVLFGGSEGNLVGSARSIDGINMYEALDVFSSGYEKFGGHSQAAGLTIKPQELDELRKKVCEYIKEHYDESVFVQKKTFDLELDVGDIKGKLVEDLARLEPFGHCNEKPALLIRSADIEDYKFIGKKKSQHLKFNMKKNGAGIEAVDFFFMSDYTLMSKKADFLCEADINDYNGRPQLVVRQLSMHYDSQLKQSFLSAYRNQMCRQFLDEVCMIAQRDKDGVPDITEAEFASEIKVRMEKSRFSMGIYAATKPAFERLINIEVVKDALVSGQLLLHDSKNYCSDNSISINRLARHKDYYYIGVLGFFDKELRHSYKEYAKEFFMKRQQMLELYRHITNQLGGGKKTMVSLMRNSGKSYEKTAFALRVFTELELIGVQKSGRIFAIKSEGRKKELTQSKTYSSFLELMEKE